MTKPIAEILSGRAEPRQGRPRGEARRGGFTLIEILVVTAIVALVVGVISACLAAGFRVWESARTCNAVESQAMLGLAILEKDLANGFVFQPVEFKGDASRLAFPCLIPWASGGIQADRELRVERIGTVAAG